VNITAEARRLIAHLSEGYPHFLQEFAHCSFEHDSDNNIDANDVWSGTLAENGALDQLGKKYFSDLYIDQIGSEDYRKVLTAMAEGLDEWTSRRDITKRSGVKQTTVDNALHALKERKIIVQNPRVRGEYKLPTKSFAVWIRVRAAAKTGETQSVVEPTLPLDNGKSG
jgi:DNA-binding transcriptional regulator YhcF (GntR family)